MPNNSSMLVFMLTKQFSSQELISQAIRNYKLLIKIKKYLNVAYKLNMKKKAVKKVAVKQEPQIQVPPPSLNANMNMNANMNITPITNVNIQQQQVPVSYSNTNTNQMKPQRVRGGMYGYRGNEATEQQNNKIYNDDEPLIERVKEQKQDAKIDIEIKAQRTMAKLKSAIDLPAMVSLKTSGGTRTSVDLICVIDNSGSMNGQKIQLVRDTLKFLIQTLTPSDRLSIITFNSFATRICGLKTVTPQNAVTLVNHANSIQSGGGTDINSGMNLALKTIRQRKHVNKVTSVFLLSDGQDGGADFRVKQLLNQPKNKELDVFSIHSFGFGTDHDEELMTNICQMKDGTFYFIKELATLDEAFCNALGGIISLVAKEVTIHLQNIAKNLVGGFKIGKTYSDLWQKVNEKQYRIKLSQLMSGITKDYVFEIAIPHIDAEVGDIDRDHDILAGSFVAKGVNSENISGQCIFKITLLNENEEIPDINENIDVIENYLRVKASDAIEENMKKADQQHYEEAQKGIDNMISYIQSNKKARKDKMEHLVNDLQQIKEKCSKQDWGHEGRKWMKNAKVAHQQQKNYQYSNAIQSEMVTKRKAMKK